MQKQAKEKNYLDGVEWINGKFINQSGGIANNYVLRYSDLILLQSGSYLFSATDKYNGGTINTRIHGYDANGSWIKQIAFQSKNGNEEYNIQFSVPEECVYIRVSTLIEQWLENAILIDN